MWYICRMHYALLCELWMCGSYGATKHCTFQLEILLIPHTYKVNYFYHWYSWCMYGILEMYTQHYSCINNNSIIIIIIISCMRLLAPWSYPNQCFVWYWPSSSSSSMVAVFLPGTGGFALCMYKQPSDAREIRWVGILVSLGIIVVVAGERASERSMRANFGALRKNVGALATNRSIHSYGAGRRSGIDSKNFCLWKGWERGIGVVLTSSYWIIYRLQ